jgi:hypothetical protein
MGINILKFLRKKKKLSIVFPCNYKLPRKQKT